MRVAVMGLLLSLAVASSSAQAEKEPADYVDVFIGTSNSRWMLGPYAAVPFGMVQLGPDNQSPGWTTSVWRNGQRLSERPRTTTFLTNAP